MSWRTGLLALLPMRDGLNRTLCHRVQSAPMSYQVLARKWRPKRFADLVGQEHVVRALGNALAEQRLHHAYLLTGTRGVGKTTIARILAKSLNCETGVTAEPCGECAACRQIDAGRFVDLLEIDAASNTGIDNIREVLDNAQYAPTSGRFKVYIIDEVHMLSKSAFNAMLKTLEEPPGHVKFILATTDPQKVPVTVLSRCLQFSLRNMTPQQVAGHLAHVLDTERLTYEPAALTLLSRAASGSMRDALSLLDQAIAYGEGVVEEAGVRAMLGAVDSRYLFALLAALADGDGAVLMQEAETLALRGIGFDAALEELAALLYRIALAQTVPAAIAVDEPEREAVMALAHTLPAEDVQLYYQIALHGRRDLGLAPDEHLGFNMTLLRMLAFHPVHAQADGGAVKPAAVAPTARPVPPVSRPPEPPVAVDAGSTRAEAPRGPSAARAALEKFIKRGAPSAGRGTAEAARVVPAAVVSEPPARIEAAQVAPAARPEPTPPWDDIPPPQEEYPAAAGPQAFGEEEAAPVIAPAAASAAVPVAEAATPLAATDEVVGRVVEPVAASVETPPAVLPDDEAEAPVFTGDWLALVESLKDGLGAQARMLAQNAELISAQGRVLNLRVPAAQRFVAGRDYQDKLAGALSAHFGVHINLAIEVGDVAGETHLMQRQRVRGELLAQAREAIESDPVVQQIQHEFGAVVLPDSIQPLEE